MQTSVVNYKELNFGLRIDAEYHKAEVLDNIHLLDMKCFRPYGTQKKIICYDFGLKSPQK